jgi:hypothetical protein
MGKGGTNGQSIQAVRFMGQRLNTIEYGVLSGLGGSFSCIGLVSKVGETTIKENEVNG